MDRPSPLVRIAPYGALVVLGVLLVLASGTADPGDRLEGRDKLVALIEREDERSRRLRAELDELKEDIEALEARAAERQKGLADVRASVDELSAAAGLVQAAGPGVRVELRDSTLRRSPTGDLNDLVIHEQDIQAAVNALWAAGAEAMAINGERITGSSAVRCVGNTLLLHGSVYAPPYVIEAIGPPEVLRAGLATDPLMQRFLIYVADFRLGYRTEVVSELVLPPYRGIVSASTARRVPAP